MGIVPDGHSSWIHECESVYILSISLTILLIQLNNNRYIYCCIRLMVVSQFMQRLIAVISLFRNVTLSIGLYDTLFDISNEASLLD